jgi:GDP-L-fucose synthase
MRNLLLNGCRVIVTGGRGFLGKFVCRNLDSRGADVVAIGREEYNLINQIDVRRMYIEQQPSIVIHLAAACGGIGANVENPARFLYENAVMGLMLLEEGRQHGLNKFVLISTTCAYPKDAPLPFQEDSIWLGKPVGATGPYGMAKRLLHEACETYELQYNLHCTVLVLANLYGPEDNFEKEKSHVIPAIIRRFVEAKGKGLTEITNWGTGSPTREFLHVADAAKAIILATEKESPCLPINIGTGVETSIRDLTIIIGEAVKYKGKISWDTNKPDGQPRRFLDVSRAKKFLGFEAGINLTTGIRETVNWYLSTHRLI